jgi:transcriptional regulator with XRE-family HTH domain
MRAARKASSLTQVEVAKELQISQSALSKLEHGILVPSAIEWFDFCRITGIPADSLVTGTIERLKPITLSSSDREGGFKLPKKYALNRGSKMRSMVPFISFFKEKLGDSHFDSFCKHQMLDADYCLDLDNTISLQFGLDLWETLIQKGALSRNQVSRIARASRNPLIHGSLGNGYLKENERSQLLASLLEHAHFYECNFDYRIEDRRKKWFEFSVSPVSHVAELGVRRGSDVGRMICEYKKSYFENFVCMGAENTSADERLHESECYFKGAAKCTYRIPLEA